MRDPCFLVVLYRSADILLAVVSGEELIHFRHHRILGSPHPAERIRQRVEACATAYDVTAIIVEPVGRVIDAIDMRHRIVASLPMSAVWPYGLKRPHPRHYMPMYYWLINQWAELKCFVTILPYTGRISKEYRENRRLLPIALGLTVSGAIRHRSGGGASLADCRLVSSSVGCITSSRPTIQTH